MTIREISGVVREILQGIMLFPSDVPEEIKIVMGRYTGLNLSEKPAVQDFLEIA
jgi:hypothetical protein